MNAEVMHILAENFALNGSKLGPDSRPSQDGVDVAPELCEAGEIPSGMMLQQLAPVAGEEAALLDRTVKSQCFLLNTGMSENAQ